MKQINQMKSLDNYDVIAYFKDEKNFDTNFRSKKIIFETEEKQGEAVVQCRQTGSQEIYDPFSIDIMWDEGESPVAGYIPGEHTYGLYMKYSSSYCFFDFGEDRKSLKITSQDNRSLIEIYF